MYQALCRAFLIILLMTIPLSLLAAPGDTIKTFPTPGCCSQGLAFDGKHLWTADRKSDMLYKVEPVSGRAVDSILAPGYSPVGLTWDGTLLWCVDDREERIYAVNPKTRIVERTIYCPVSQPGDMAWDGKYLWICDNAENKIHKISAEDGTTLHSITSPSDNPGGLTFDGKYLWVSDRVKDEIYMVTPDKGDCLIILKAPGPYPCGLAWSQTGLWNVDYQTDLLTQVVVDDSVRFAHYECKAEEVAFIHQVRNFGPDLVKTLDVYMAVPQDRDNQDLLDTVRFSPEPSTYLYDKWDQRIAYFQYADLKANAFTEITMTARAKLYQTRYFIFPEKVGYLHDIPLEISQQYLVDDAKFDINSEIMQKAVKEAVGKENNPYWIARKIYNYVIDKIEYELSGGWNIAPVVLERGTGSCSEYSFVFIGLCRAAGIPARYVGAITVRGDDASWDDVFHRWVEIFLPGYGWIPVDPSGGDSVWPRDRANSFGYLNNRYLITTAGGGGSEYLEWGYNAGERWQSRGRCKIVVENFGEWTPLTIDSTSGGLFDETGALKECVPKR